MIDEVDGSMISWKRFVYTLLVAVLLLLPAARPPAITIKVASLVPEGSPWHKALLKIAAEWREISDGRILVKIYPAGVAGDETIMDDLYAEAMQVEKRAIEILEEHRNH